MLRNTFLHAPGVGHCMEQRLWAAGITSWESLSKAGRFHLPLGPGKKRALDECIRQSIQHLEAHDPRFFADLLPPGEVWRLFPEFRHSVAYLDIETTGLGTFEDHVTTISLYDGTSVFTFVHGENLQEFERTIEEYRIIVTYNGKCFDVPFIGNSLGIKLDQVHIDLRYVLRSLGYTGGLKGCERKLGLDRGNLEGVDGFFAVLLWDDYRRSGNHKALETLLAYNILDVLNLETLMVTAYNLKVRGTPFEWSHLLNPPDLPPSPFQPDLSTIERIKRRLVHFP
ncbi:MAG: ribonuclease H-like domain-containing protein [Syntrophobacteraceae bacterium]|nr:ribonuclease H-like domain-containing protein [Syntrophobacteraceae bacterium]